MLALSLIGLRDGRDMRKYFAWFFLFAVTIAVGVAAKALAASEQRVVLPVRNLGVTKTLPKATLRPVGHNSYRRRLRTAGDSGIIPRHAHDRLHQYKGVAICPPIGIEAATTSWPVRACPTAIVGKGNR